MKNALHLTENALNTPVADGITRREGLLSLLGTALALAGCGGGGGGGVAGVSSGGTGSFSAGPITGFGSIIVNGVHFDETASSILDIDDNNDMRGKLKLGMMVRVKGKPKKGNRADAETIEVRSELLGPIDSINTTAKTLMVLGQTVQVTATTIFEEGLTGLSALKTGDIVEVHGFVDPVANRMTATRIEPKDPTKVKAFKLQGTVSAFDATAKTFKIGTLTISFASLLPADLPANLANLVNPPLVRVRLATTPTTGTRTALKIRVVEAEVEDRNEAEVEGTITAFTSSSTFSVNGQPVNASGASVPAGLKPGDRVEVEGRLVNGVLVANKVELEDENDLLKFELDGTITTGSLNTTAKTFVLSGVTVDYSTTTDFRNGTAADLAGAQANNKPVEVKGVASTDGTKIKATRISFE